MTLSFFKCFFCPAGQKLNCGHRFHLKEERPILIRWTSNQNQRCVCVCVRPGCWTVGNPMYSKPYRFTVSHTHFPLQPQEFFLWTANDEVIVYFPTGGFLGDSSLSARLWHSLQFLPTEWKVEAKVWLHVGNGLTSLRLYVHIFLTYTITHGEHPSGVCHLNASQIFVPLCHRSVGFLHTETLELCATETRDN